MTLTGFIVVLLSVAAVQGLDEWRVTYTSQQICALKGSTVTMSCTYTHPAYVMGVQTFWFTKLDNTFTDLKTDSDYTSRVHSDCDGQNCFLTISQLRETDSADYKFRITTSDPQKSWFGSPGINLSVTDCSDLQVHVSSSGDTNVQAGLRCRSSCHLPDNLKYTWFKNNETFLSQSSSFSTIISLDDSIACGIESCPMSRSPTVYAPRVPTVYVNTSGEISEGSSVTLTCSSDANPPVTKYTWYKRNSNTDQQPVGGKNQLVFESIQASDSGEYYCKAENELRERTSEYIRVHVQSSSTSIVVGVTVAVLLLLILVTVFFLFRRKRASKKADESELEPHGSEKCPPGPPKEQDNLHYITVDFRQNQANPLYSNTRAAQHHKPHDKPVFSEYSAVRFHNNTSEHRVEESPEDPSLMYRKPSGINKSVVCDSPVDSGRPPPGDHA